MKTETVYCVPRKHRFANRSSIDIPTIGGEPLVMFKSSFFQNEVVNRQFAQHDITRISSTTPINCPLSRIHRGNLATGFMFWNIAESDPEIVGIIWIRPYSGYQPGMETDHYIYTDITRFINV
jgi:hypothetical protein